MLSDVCHEFCSDTKGVSDDDMRQHLPDLKSGIDDYRNGAVIKYDPRLIELIDTNVKKFEENQINGERLWFVLSRVVGFLDMYPDPAVNTIEALFATCEFTPA